MLGLLLVLNAVAGVIAAAFFVSVFYADGIDPYMAGTYEWLLANPAATSVMAFRRWRVRCSWVTATPSARRRKEACPKSSLVLVLHRLSRPRVERRTILVDVHGLCS